MYSNIIYITISKWMYKTYVKNYFSIFCVLNQLNLSIYYTHTYIKMIASNCNLILIFIIAFLIHEYADAGNLYFFITCLLLILSYNQNIRGLSQNQPPKGKIKK